MGEALERWFTLAKEGKSDDECWEVPPHPNGKRRHVKVNGKCVDVHRYAYLTRVGEIPKHLEVMHKCDNKYCCNPSHLELGTRQQNVQDAYDRGRYKNKGATYHGKSDSNRRT